MAVTPMKGGGNPPNVNTVLQSNPGDRVSPDAKRISPIVAVMSRQMPLPQAQQLAGQTVTARVAQNGPGENVELEFNGQRIPVQLKGGRGLTAGELITVAFALGDNEEASKGDKSKGARRTLDVNQLLNANSEEEGESDPNRPPSLINKLSSSARLIGLLERLGQPKGSSNTQTSAQSRPISTLLSQDTVLDMVDPDGNPVPTRNANNTKAGRQGAAAAFAKGNEKNTAQSTQARAGATPQTAATPQTSGQAAQTTQAPLPGQTTPTGQATATTQLGAPQAAQGAANLNPMAAGRQMSGLLAQQVSQAVETSGLFYESHLQQWANGERTKSQLSLEPQARYGPDQVVSDKGLDPNAINQSVRMVAQQLSTLDQSRINIVINGLFQQPVELEIAPDHKNPEEETPENEGSKRWVAKLKLDMPSLGPLEVRLRMMGQRLDILLMGEAGSKKLIDQHWPDIQKSLEAKGLELTQGQMRVTEKSRSDS